MRKLMILAATCGFLAACQTVDFSTYPKTLDEVKSLGGVQLTNIEIEKLVTGKEFSVQAFSGKYAETLKTHAVSADKTFKIIATGERRGSDAGTWQVKYDKFCETHTEWAGGREICHPIYKHAHGYSLIGRDNLAEAVFDLKDL